MYGRCGIRSRWSRICSLLLPEYIWLATGGKSQFNDRLMVLKGRKVTAFPDIDGYDEWRKKAKNYPMLDITISDILERNATPDQRERQVDIADLLLEEILKERQLNMENLFVKNGVE